MGITWGKILLDIVFFRFSRLLADTRQNGALIIYAGDEGKPGTSQRHKSD